MATLNKLWNQNVFKVYDGVTLLADIDDAHLKALHGLEIKDSDILLYTFPKSGTHWMKNIISHLIDGGKISDVEDLSEYFPFLHEVKPVSGLETFQNLPTNRRIAQTHVPIKMVPQQTVMNGKSKVIYMARNPKDVLVSGYHFWSKFLDGFSGTFQDYFDMFVFRPEELVYGDHLEHVHQWWIKRHEPNMSIVFYEDLKIDPYAEIQRISQFLGFSHTDQEISDIVKSTHFNKQKSWGDNKRFRSSMPLLKELNFFRKGEVGDWVNHFTVAQDRIFDDVYRRRTEAMDDPIPFKFEIDR